MPNIVSIQGTVRLLAALTALLLCTESSAQDQQTEVNRLNQEVEILYRQGNYPQAVIVAKQALSVAEKDLGPDTAAAAGRITRFNPDSGWKKQ